MTSVTASALLAHVPDADFVLTDADDSALRRAFGDRAGAHVRLSRVDLFDRASLAAAASGATLIVNGAGPFHKTAAVVRRVAIELGADYLDIDDDVESCLEAVELDATARGRGVALYVGCGASPGLTNVLAADLLTKLDEPESVEVAWVAGDEGPRRMGRAVAEHALHIGAGECRTWRNGAPFITESFLASKRVEMGPVLGEIRLYECAHPETVMLPASFPALRDAWCWGGLHPQPVNGLLRGIAQAVKTGHLDVDEGCCFLQAIMADENGSLRGWQYAFRGMLGQVVRREIELRDLVHFLSNALRKRHEPCVLGIAASAVGNRNGRRARLTVRSPLKGTEKLWKSMAVCTGTVAAAFTLSALANRRAVAGTVFPEKACDLGSLLANLRALGFEREDAIDSGNGDDR
jgi:hypothetical protein